MEHSIIGLIVGVVMGITGAGGALISIPLFVTMLNTSVKEATVLSLLAVILGTAVNLIGQQHRPDRKIVIPFVVFGALANYATLSLKAMMPDIGIAGLLLLIGIYSLWSIWKIPEKEGMTVNESFLKTCLIGVGLGVVTTLTGLGGGVLLVPILRSLYAKSYQEALPTSLLTILLISGISFLTQMDVGFQLITFMELTLMGAGAIASFYLLKMALRKLSKELVDIIRKLLFTAVIVYSVTSVLIKSI